MDLELGKVLQNITHVGSQPAGSSNKPKSYGDVSCSKNWLTTKAAMSDSNKMKKRVDAQW